MNRCKYCGTPLTLTPEYDTCMECQGRIMRESTIPQGAFATNSTQPSMNIYDEALELVITKVRARESGSIEKEKIIKALKRAKIEHELLDLYRLQQEFQERYNTEERLIQKMHCLEELNEIRDELYNKEKELEELV